MLLSFNENSEQFLRDVDCLKATFYHMASTSKPSIFGEHSKEDIENFWLSMKTTFHIVNAHIM
jgi:hypothetical protein